MSPELPEWLHQTVLPLFPTSPHPPDYCPQCFSKSQFWSYNLSAWDASTILHHLQEKFKLVFSEALPRPISPIPAHFHAQTSSPSMQN